MHDTSFRRYRRSHSATERFRRPVTAMYCTDITIYNIYHWGYTVAVVHIIYWHAFGVHQKYRALYNVPPI